MAQSDALYESLSGTENLEFFGKMKGLTKTELSQAIHHAVQVVDLSEHLNKTVAGYSGGMKRRLSLAIAFLGNPRLLILDEPTVGIDPALRRQVWRELRQLKKNGVGILVTTHVMDEAELTDKVGLLLDGRIMAFDSPANLKSSYQVNSIEDVFLKGRRRIMMRIFAISKKVLTELLRDKRSLALLFLAPIFIMWLMNIAFSASTDTNVQIASVNVSNAVKKSLDGVKHISTKGYKTEYAAKKALKDKKADAVLVYKGKEKYKLTYANTDTSKTALTRQAVKSTLKQVQVQELLQNLKKAQQQASAKAAQANRLPDQYQNNSQSDMSEANLNQTKQTNIQQTTFDISEDYIYGNKDTTFFTKIVPILMGFFVFFFVFLISGMALLKERTTGTLDRLLATPVKRSDIVFGYMLSYGAVAALQTTIIVLSTVWLLKLKVLGSMIDIILVNILFALVALSFGLLLSTLAQSEFQMMQFIPIIIVPQVFFSGIIPLDSMANWIQSMGKFLPLYYAGHALSEIVLQGTSILNLESDLFVLLIFLSILTVLNIVGLKRYRKV